MGRDKELGCFCDSLLREDKRGNKGANWKTSDIKCLFTPCESLTVFCFKNMLGIHLIFEAHPLPSKPSTVHRKIGLSQLTTSAMQLPCQRWLDVLRRAKLPILSQFLPYINEYLMTNKYFTQSWMFHCLGSISGSWKSSKVLRTQWWSLYLLIHVLLYLATLLRFLHSWFPQMIICRKPPFSAYLLSVLKFRTLYAELVFLHLHAFVFCLGQYNAWSLIFLCTVRRFYTEHIVSC